MQEQPARQGMTIGDGFKFGCGFIFAGLVFNIILFAILAVVAIIASLLGIGYNIFQPPSL